MPDNKKTPTLGPMGEEVAIARDSELSVWKWFGWGSLGIVVLTVLYWAGLQLWVCEVNRGTFGDMFGGLNTLFSGFAFLGLILAIVLQKQELNEQRKEITLARTAHQETARTMKAQHESAERAARIQGLNLLIVAQREQLQGLERPSTVVEAQRKRRGIQRLADLVTELERLVVGHGG